jgi:hypothetical protein
MLTAYIITVLIMEAVHTSETSIIFYGLTSRKTVFLKLVHNFGILGRLLVQKGATFRKPVLLPSSGENTQPNNLGLGTNSKDTV